MQSLLLKKEAVKEFTRNIPWIWRSMIQMTSQIEICEPGELVQICDARAKPIGVGYINPKNILTCRVLSFKAGVQINEQFFSKLFARALSKREKIFADPFYRLVHSESDMLPGLVVDRFGEILVCQTSTAGMEKLKPLWLPALHGLLKPEAIILRDDVPARKKEGLKVEVSIYLGEVPPLVQVKEPGRLYYANLLEGQKTGWFYDQRANRTYLSELCEGREVLDLYSHSGGFGMAAAKGNAAHVTMVDSSALALDLAKDAAKLNKIEELCSFTRADAYEYLELAVKEGKKFDIVMADPPAFIKEKKYVMSGLKGYQKLAFLCASVAKDIFCIASCSHHANAADLRRAVEDGIKKSGRKFKLVHKAGADSDHPVHPSLPESQYLKFLAYELE